MIDAARGVALVAMTVYHFSWDLAMFHLIDPHFPYTPAMIWFARSIAGSFLFLVGVSLVLAHGRGIRWRQYFTRLAMIAGAAALITLATYFATPQGYIFFGILHSIAVASIFGLAFLRMPWWLIAAFAVFFLFAGESLRTTAFDAPIWWWTGLSTLTPRSNDFVPIFPFFGMVLAGIAAATAVRRSDLFERLGWWQGEGAFARGVRFIGRHGLIYYLLHQPVMIGLLAGIVKLTGHI
jgi:uncharacterized membrane protein